MRSQRAFADGAIDATTLDHKGYLTIEAADRKNAINYRMWREIPLAVDWLCGHADLRCIVLRGGGEQDFSAGADITEFDTLRGDPVTARDYEHANAAAFRSIRLCPVPVIAMIRGVCFGGAFGLAAAADLRIASHDSQFSVPAGRLGLAYPVEAMADIVEALGQSMARMMLYTARQINAKEALATGLLLAVFHASDLADEAERLADEICGNAPLSNRASKAAIRATLTGGTAERLQAHELAEATFSSADYREGRQAFGEKRQPVFSGA